MKNLVSILDTARCIAYDVLHGVQTCGEVPVRGLTIRGSSPVDGLKYQPNPPSTTRHLLNAVEIDFGETTFIDMGSGKGRVLLVAAEYPFKSVVGVEFAEELHAIANRNIRSYRGRLRSVHLESICKDAVDFVFPDGPLFIHFFNPFPGPVLHRVLGNLVTSVKHRPVRLAFLSGAYPKDVLGTMPQIKQVSGIKYFDLYTLNTTEGPFN